MPELDIPTLMFAGAFAAFVSGTMLLLAYVQYREMSPVLWWAASAFAMAFGVMALAVADRPNGHIGIVASALLTLAPGLLWIAARRFNGLRAPLAIVLAGPPLAMAESAGGLLPSGPFFLSVAIPVAFLLAAAYTLAFQSRQPLISRWPLAALCVAHALALAALVPEQMYPAQSGFLGFLYRIIHFEALIFLLGTTMFVVGAMRESRELMQKDAAETDDLTGLLNRRSFLERGRRLVERYRRAGTTCSVAALDLDHFKAINDTFGHAAGDRALQVFAETTQRCLRPNDLFARTGGEEFAIVLSGAGPEAAHAIADRIRAAFRESAVVIDGHQVGATVSIGLSSLSAEADLPLLMRRADAALYRAKLRGRNRVESAGAAEAGARSRLVRLA